jgi:hypothetical protein
MYNIDPTRTAIRLLGNLGDIMGPKEEWGMNDVSLGLG